MYRKYDIITELYNRTCKSVVESPENWERFLRSACRNFKLRFDEQILVYAQRPDATAVLEIERWNTAFGRWVNKGATGIAVFEDPSRYRQRLTHYFDISDTHSGRYSREVPIWEMKPEYETAVIETLESSFGTLTYKSNLKNAIYSAAVNAVEDNIEDYLNEFLVIAKNNTNSYDADEISAAYISVVTESVSYMMMSRLGIKAEEIDKYSFDQIVFFDTPEMLGALGVATSDIAEMGLTEISKTVIALDKENRIIDDNNKMQIHNL